MHNLRKKGILLPFWRKRCICISTANRSSTTSKTSEEEANVTTLTKATGQGRPILSVDLDGTALESNNTVHPDVGIVLQEAAKTGMSIVFTSDTSRQGLVMQMARIGLRPEYVAGFACENGAYSANCTIPGMPKEQWFAPDGPMQKQLYRRMRDLTVECFIELGWQVFLTHPFSTVEHMTRIAPISDTLVLVDNTRLVSMTMAVRGIKLDGTLEDDPSHYRRVGEAFRRVVEPLIGGGPLRPEIGDTFIDCCAVGARKSDPVQAMRATGRPVYHFGDGGNDRCVSGVDGVVVVAVGANTTLGRSGAAHHVTINHGPEGLIEAVREVISLHTT